MSQYQQVPFQEQNQQWLYITILSRRKKQVVFGLHYHLIQEQKKDISLLDNRENVKIRFTINRLIDFLVMTFA